MASPPDGLLPDIPQRANRLNHDFRHSLLGILSPFRSSFDRHCNSAANLARSRRSACCGRGLCPATSKPPRHARTHRTSTHARASSHAIDRVSRSLRQVDVPACPPVCLSCRYSFHQFGILPVRLCACYFVCAARAPLSTSYDPLPSRARLLRPPRPGSHAA